MSNPEYYDRPDMAGWRAQRLHHITDHYGPDYFRGKTVLEVAAAWGHIGAHFQNEWGAIVTCTDHYDGWVDIIRERHPQITTFVQNINDPWPSDVHYDVLIHMGVIYHQPAHLVEPRLLEACIICDEMILETTVYPNGNPEYIEALPKPNDLWEPIGTEYCMPSTEYIERILTTSGMTFERVDYVPSRSLWFCKK